MHILQVILLILIGVGLFGFVIFFHEFGHFLMAKLSKIRVNEFALGMGPKLFSFQKGETRYALRLFPIGGFCAMEGEDEESDDENAFGNKPVWKRILVVAAGGIFNIFLGFVLMTLMIAPEELYGTNVISSFREGSTLQAAGAQTGDKIIELDGYKINIGRDTMVALSLAQHPDDINVKVQRNGERIDLGSVDFSGDTEKGEQSVVVNFNIVGEKRTFFSVLKYGVLEVHSVMRMVLASLKGIISGRFGLNDMAGPVGTAQAISEAAGAGLQNSFGDAVYNIVFMIILITVNLGIVNLMPLPALDGGRLLFLIWEAITRKPVPPKYEGYIHAAGFVLLIGLMLVLTASDILRIIRGDGLAG